MPFLTPKIAGIAALAIFILILFGRIAYLTHDRDNAVLKADQYRLSAERKEATILDLKKGIRAQNEAIVKQHNESQARLDFAARQVEKAKKDATAIDARIRQIDAFTVQDSDDCAGARRVLRAYLAGVK